MDSHIVFLFSVILFHTNEGCRNVTSNVSCKNDERVHISNISFNNCHGGSKELYIVCSNDTSCNITVTTQPTQLFIDYYCSDKQNENCAVLNAASITRVSCPDNFFIEAEYLVAYFASGLCANRYFPAESLYQGKIKYFPINYSSVSIPNYTRNRALLLYNCSRSMTSTRYYSQDTYSHSVETYRTEDGVTSAFKTTDSQLEKGTSTNLESNIPVDGIVVGVTSFVLVVIVAVLIVFRYYRSRRPANKSSATADVRHARFNENVLANHKTPKNECFTFDSVANSTKLATNEKCQQPFTVASDQNDAYGSNNDYDNLGNRRNNTTANNKQTLYDHLGTVGQDNSMYTGAYDHINRCKRREDDDGVYDVGERKQTDDDYDVSGNFVLSRRDNNLYSTMH